MEGVPSGAEQQGEDISVSSGGKQTCQGSSSKDSLSSNSIPDNLDYETEVNRNDQNGKLVCPSCNTEIEPKVHKFCYECGKSVQEMVFNEKEQRDIIPSKSPVSESGEAEQAVDRVNVISSDIAEVKQFPVEVIETGQAETMSQQLIAQSVNVLPGENFGEKGTTSPSASLKHVVVKTCEIPEIKKDVVKDQAVAKTLVESAKHSSAFSEAVDHQHPDGVVPQSSAEHDNTIPLNVQKKQILQSEELPLEKDLRDTGNQQGSQRADKKTELKNNFDKPENIPSTEVVKQHMQEHSQQTKRPGNDSKIPDESDMIGDRSKMTACEPNNVVGTIIEPGQNSNENSRNFQETDINHRQADSKPCKSGDERKPTASVTNEGFEKIKTKHADNSFKLKEIPEEKPTLKTLARPHQPNLPKTDGSSEPAAELKEIPEEKPTLKTLARPHQPNLPKTDGSSEPAAEARNQDQATDKDKKPVLTVSNEVSDHPLSEANGSSEPAVKDQGENQGAGKKKKKKGPKNANGFKSCPDEKTLTVVFHAILSSKFKRDDGTNIVIRGEEPVFHGWNKDSIPVSTEEYLDKLLLYAELKIPLSWASYKPAYKYVLVDKKDKATYEYLVEFSAWRGHVNRCLVVGNEYVTENKTFHKYDGYIYPKPTTWSSIQRLWTDASISVTDDRRAFFREFFPKWRGFYVDKMDCKIQGVEALQKLACLVDNVSSFWTSSSGYKERHKNDYNKLRLGELFKEILMPKANENLKSLTNQPKDPKSTIHAVVSSVVIAYVFTKYHVNLKLEQCETLLKCFRLPPDREVCSEILKCLNEFEDNVLSSLNEVIIQFYKQQSSKKPVVVSWIQALPLLHFLRRESVPFEDLIDVKPVDVKTWKWWGLGEFPCREIRRNIESEVMKILPNLKDLFEMDRLLKRTYLLLCPVDLYGHLVKTEQFSCLELCVTLRKLLPDTKISSSYTSNFVEYLVLLFREINHGLSNLSCEQFSMPVTLVILDNLKYLVYILKNYLKLNGVEILCRLVECSTTVIILQKSGSDLQEESEQGRCEGKPPGYFKLSDIPNEMLSLYKDQCCNVAAFVDANLPVHLIESCTYNEWKKELQAWNQLLSLSAPEVFFKPWKDNFLDKFQTRINKASLLRQIKLYCQAGEHNCHPDIATCLSKAAFEAVEKVVENGQGEQPTFAYLNENISMANVVNLLGSMLEKSWPSELKENGKLNEKEKEEILLKHLLTWSIWPGFLKSFGSCSKTELTVGNCGIIMGRAVSCVEGLVNSVIDGSVTTATLKVLEKHSEQFLKLGEVHQTNENGPQHVPIKTAFQQRISEIKEFRKVNSQLECFLGLCNFTSVDEELTILTKKNMQDFSELSIRDVCVKRSDGFSVIFFELDDKYLDMVSRITEIKGSKIFLNLWRKYSEKLQIWDAVTMEIIFQIWMRVCEKLKDINEQFLSGEMLLKDIDKYLDLFQANYADLEVEFKLLSRFLSRSKKELGEAENNLDARITQVKKYKKISDARQAGKSILELKEKLGLTGDFSVVEKIEEIISGNLKRLAIKSVDKDLLQAGELLDKIDEKRRKCLTTFTECFDLVTWLRESINDEQELKVFVDLAMISAGEDDMEIDRISCMHTSCLGFGSLIFGYETNHGFDELMRLCQPVWHAVDTNPGVGQKLVSTKNSLSWLKQIKESHGSVALTTMVQVEAINSCGTYHIADTEMAKEVRHANAGVGLNLENLVCLNVPEDPQKNRERKVYSLEEIKDVQSKLMLIAGKAESGKEEVDKFNEIFDGILRISHLYLQLCEVGQINYLTWKDKYQCSKADDERNSLLENIKGTCETMERDLKEWKEYFHDARNSCYSLNHFTMKQILHLRLELAKACVGHVAIDELRLQTFMLLESVYKNIEPLLLANVLKTKVPENAVFFTEESSKDGEKYFENDMECEGISSENIEEDVTFPSQQRRKMSLETFTSAKEKLEGMGFDEEDIVAALQICGRDATEEDLIAHVISGEDDKETVMKLCEDAKRNPQLSDLISDLLNSECQSGDAEESKREIKEEKIDRRPVTLYVKNKEDTYLSLEILTDILDELSESAIGAESQRMRRKMPSGLMEGEPNLLLVPKGEVFGCLLSLFMGSEARQPLPTDEEVIVCDENTTAEEIELLWRRAVVDDKGQLFCLANADLLDYDVSQQVVRSLELLTQGHSKYHLVVICSIENEDRSNMVASLDQNRRHFPPIPSMKGIQNYLKEQLMVSGTETVGNVHLAPAATVDMEKLSVRVIQSSRAGMGKSLFIEHLAEQLENLLNNKRLRGGLVPSLCATIPVHGISVDSDCVTRKLLSHAVKRDIPVSRIFHLDVSQSVVKGIDNILFQLLILRVVKDKSGNVWRRKSTDMYVVELTTDKSFEALTADASLSNSNYSQTMRKRLATEKYSFVKYLPRTHCSTPRETLDNIRLNKRGNTGFDMEKFRSEEYQRTFQYLTQFAAGQNLDKFLFIYDPRVTIGDPVDALTIMIKYCGIRDPSWAELYHFVNFLNVQLRDCEESVFCNAQLVGDLLQGFKTFVVRFMIEMSRDFATRSLSDSNLGVDDTQTADEDDDLAPFEIRKRWESSPHPYIFFNHDRVSMTFLGFRLSDNGDLLDPATNKVLEQKMMEPTLRGQLKHQGVNFDTNYEKRDKMARIEKLCSVMGIEFLYDPDPTYELTTDNVKKILAIHMRFRCGIPVIIMGETGCGKTRLIRFMCELQAGPEGPKNLLLMKVHGGTSYSEIEMKVVEAEKRAFFNQKINVDTVLFFDEANTTDAIDLIKEIMVDRRVNGRAINPELTKLHFIAACNPYRKHTKEMIQKLESAGLGYHVSADETDDKLGSIPLRQLVYRVHPLPESMRPLVWDFGRLTDHTEELYAAQIVRRSMVATTSDVTFDGTEAQASCIAKVLSASQKYMREQKNECSFVSLRDVERAMKVITWFYSNSELIIQIIGDVDENGDKDSSSEESSEEEDYKSDEEFETGEQPLSQIARALILGIGVCYYARLNTREAYCQEISRYFDNSCPLPGGGRRMQREIERCQRGFLNDIQLGQNIAKNIALSENVFMMAICTELRIPLFVVGKPGSSKSLAKDVISTNMKAGNSQSELFKNLKQIHIQSYQCSPLSTPEGIVSTFKQCAKLQKDKDLKKFVSVVVLDEIGLAEDSPLMPLKTLHPLLEDGTATTEESGTTSDYHRVGFIGLSNWALDPAKMNRGIMLSRGVPNEKELQDSASGICSSDQEIKLRLETTISRLCRGYFELYEKQSKSKTLKEAQKDEFFGLRDFYSLVKMVFGFAVQKEEQGDQISDIELEKSIRRNFSGLDDIDPVKTFCKHFQRLKESVKRPSPECFPVNLIQESLVRTEKEGESRYLLVLTENYAALRLLQGQFYQHDPVIIFGSSFPKDQQYTQICRNINRIKVCMETGRMVILLNLESLYESLYDALNQYYVYLANQKYVDLGLGNHRVKCRVANEFKLIVVAEKDVVYRRFPIPLINRLEKHLLVMSTGLTKHQAVLVEKLQKWVKIFSEASPEFSCNKSLFTPGDCFVGYHSDTAAAVIIKISNIEKDWPDDQILLHSKLALLQCASPDAIARLPATKMKRDAEELWNVYFKTQRHGSLKDYLVDCLDKVTSEKHGSLIQITTHSRLLSPGNSRSIASDAGFKGPNARCISLQEFNTEQQFTKTLEEFFVSLGGAEGLLLVQCDNGEANFNLIACCRHLVDDTRRRKIESFDGPVKPIHVVFIIQLPKIAGGCQHFVGFQGGKWLSIHIDELLESSEQLPQIEQLMNRSVSDLFKPVNLASSDDIESMDVDEHYDGDVRMEDIELEESNEKQTALSEIKAALLLKNCLQAAAARIYDESAEIDRATKRIEILLEFLPEDDTQETELSQILASRVYGLLVERDEKCFQDQKLWLQHEALSQGHLQETGTFRKALWQKLSSIVSPILSEVIAFCDRNHNLNIPHEGKDWKSRLWFWMLSEVQITPLTYDSFISPESQRIRERAFVQNTGFGHRFNGKFPFSWIIKDIVSDLLIKVAGDPSKTLLQLRGIFYQSPLGNYLKVIFEDKENKKEVTENYLHDFLHMMYKPIENGELQLIYDASFEASGQIHQLLHENEDFDIDIPFIHFTYSLIEARLARFSDLVHAFPGLVKELLRLSDRLKVGEMILDTVALEYCLQKLEPTPKDLESSGNRSCWCNRVQRVGQVVKDLKSLKYSWKQQQNKDGNQAGFVTHLFGEKSIVIFEKCRMMWIRLDVVRMFIEHTCPPGQRTYEANAQNAFKLWKVLGENLDFSTVRTMTAVERFLKDCCDRISKRFRYDITQCEICKLPLRDPILMPCDHTCCMPCARGWFKDHNACPMCRKEVGNDFKVVANKKCRDALEMYNNFRNRCKSFFVELVSLYCFREQLPEPDLVRKFINYVINDENKTEAFTPFGGQGIDVTPVIRSYILQQLLAIKERRKEVLGYLEEYLRRAKGLGEREHLIEVCVLCVQCMEDVETVTLLKAREGGENVQLNIASRILDRSLRNISSSSNTLTVSCLEDIAGIRSALEVVSSYLSDDFADNVKRFPKLSNCLASAKQLCSRFVVKLFLLKQLVRHDPNGIDAVKERCRKEELNWIMPPQSEEQDKTPDPFIVHRDEYHTVREALGKALLTSSLDNLRDVLQDLQIQPPARSCYILLALFREVTTNFGHSNKDDRIPSKVLKTLRKYITGIKDLPNEVKSLAESFLENFGNANSQILQSHPHQSATDRRLIDLLTHFLVIIKCSPQNQLLQPFSNLALNPAMMVNAFIPTMPHDDGPEVMRATTGKWYECPQGHRYVITECGRPNQNYNCPTCHSPIGGMNYGLAANNRDASREDRTSTGHILGRAQPQRGTVESERNMNPLSCGVLRCLTHLAMLLGTDQDIQRIAATVKPAVGDVVQFLKEHIKNDIRCIARNTGHNDVDAEQIIHLVLVGIMNNTDQQRGLNFDIRLTTKESRAAWEDAFLNTYLNPVLSNISNLLQESLGRMVRDERLGNNRLMKLIYEHDDPKETVAKELTPMCPALWRHRKKITIEYLSFKFQEYSQDGSKLERCEVLAEFLKKEQHLRALQYLPDIVKLQRLLFEKFHRRLDRNEAETYTIGKFLKSVSQVKEQFISLIDSFRKAWKIVRTALVQDGPFSISQEMCSFEVTNSTVISMFLPARSGVGRCALALNNFLVTLHNDFIGRCKSLLKDESRLPDMSLKSVTKAHLVAYDPEKDFIPIILAHCDYSLNLGEETVLEFNWKSLERQIVDRFIRGRPRLTSLVELFVFSKDICDGEVFKALQQKIPQVELTRPVQDQILNELNQLTDVCDVLKSLHIAIGFLSSAGGDPSMSVFDYLHSGLKMEVKNGLKSRKAEQFCELQHIVSLWLLLSLERARILTKHKQDPFDDVTDTVKVSLETKQKFALNGGLQKLNVDRFVLVLLEFILLYLKNVPDDQLHFPLSEYMNAKLDELNREVIDALEEYVPEDITVKHAVEAWKIACRKSEDYHLRLEQ